MLFLRETGLWSSRGRFFDSSQFSFVSHSCARAGGPDDLPNWLLKEYADILAAPIAEILNTSFSEYKVPRAWKIADVPPLPNPSTIDDINKDLRPISLTSTLSKVAEGFVIDMDLKPVMLSVIDSSQFGFIPGSCTTFALVSMFHQWLRATDGNGSTVRTALLDFRKAFDLVDHHILAAKLLAAKSWRETLSCELDN